MRKSYLEVLVLVSLHVSMYMNLHTCDVKRENNLIFIVLQSKEEPSWERSLPEMVKKKGKIEAILQRWEQAKDNQGIPWTIPPIQMHWH